MFEKSTTYERVAQLLHYDPETGWFTRTGKAPRTHRVGKRNRSKNLGVRAGTKHRVGYRYVCIDYVKYPEHQLAFLLMTGEWPACQVDHINRVKDDNRWCNLRLATRNNLDNGQNVGVGERNKSGVTGISWNSKHEQWYVFIKADKRQHYLGHFSDIFEAACARKSAELRYHTFAHT